MNACFQLAYIGPGGPEFVVVMLVLLVLFGAKDAPRMLRKLNEFIVHLRTTAENFKREVMFSDLDDRFPDPPEYDDGEAEYEVCEFDGDDDASQPYEDECVALPDAEDKPVVLESEEKHAQ